MSQEQAEKFAIAPASLVLAKQPAALQVYGVMALTADWKTGTFYIGVRKLVEATGYTERTVIRAKQWLLDHGYVQCTRKGAGHKASEFVISFRRHDVSSNGDTTTTLETCHEDNAKGDTRATHPYPVNQIPSLNHNPSPSESHEVKERDPGSGSLEEGDRWGAGEERGSGSGVQANQRELAVV